MNQSRKFFFNIFIFHLNIFLAGWGTIITKQIYGLGTEKSKRLLAGMAQYTVFSVLWSYTNNWFQDSVAGYYVSLWCLLEKSSDSELKVPKALQGRKQWHFEKNWLG